MSIFEMLRTVASPEKFLCHIWSDKGAEGKELWMSLSKMRGKNLKLLMSPAWGLDNKKVILSANPFFLYQRVGENYLFDCLER